MREIKFRAWDSKNKKMINVSSLTWFKDNIELIRGYLGEFTSAKRDSKDVFLKDGDKLMQYTGLKDKNGKEIYEGDVIHFSAENEYNDNGFERLEYCDVLFEDACFYAGPCHLSDIYDIEIVGNIYENPELLNKTEE